MLALSSASFPTNIRWPLDESISHDHHNYHSNYNKQQILLYQPEIAGRSSPLITTPVNGGARGGDDPHMTKKLNHNANERDRRKNINCLYSSLRSLLPSTDHMKKLSIPATVSHVVKYIPELQQQVEGLMKKKEELLLRICGRDEGDNLGINKESQTQNAATNNYNSSCVSSASWISDNELVIHISSNKIHGTPLSEILPCFEKDGLLLLNAFTFESFGGRIFYNLHFQVLNFK